MSLLVAVWKGVYARSEYFLCLHDELFVNVYTYCDSLYETNESTLFFGVQKHVTLSPRPQEDRHKSLAFYVHQKFAAEVKSVFRSPSSQFTLK